MNIDYQLPVTQLSVLGALWECEGDRDIHVAKHLFPRLHTFFCLYLFSKWPSFKFYKNILKCGC